MTITFSLKKAYQKLLANSKNVLGEISLPFGIKLYTVDNIQWHNEETD